MDNNENTVKKYAWVRQVFPAVMILLAIIWLVKGFTEFGFFNMTKGGTPATMPIICSSVLLIAGIISLINSFKEKVPEFKALCFIYFIIVAALIYASKLIGLLPALLIFVFIWVKCIEKDTWGRAIMITAIMAVLGFGLFQMVLHVPFPKGLIYDTFIR